MTDTPPFDPPYFTSIPTEAGVRVVETLSDGTTREVPGTIPRSVLPVGESSSKTTRLPDQAPHRFSKPSPRSDLPVSDRRAVLFLNVPFAEKDEAKRLGARWDAAARKWYVPHGTDVNLFSKWWPEELKKEAKAFGRP